MKTFAVLISCLHPQSCAIPNGWMQSHFTAESVEMCQQNISVMIEMEGRINPRDLRITCTLERGA